MVVVVFFNTPSTIAKVAEHESRGNKKAQDGLVLGRIKVVVRPEMGGLQPGVRNAPVAVGEVGKQQAVAKDGNTFAVAGDSVQMRKSSREARNGRDRKLACT
jgi:hypothetical protein